MSYNGFQAANVLPLSCACGGLSRNGGADVPLPLPRWHARRSCSPGPSASRSISPVALAKSLAIAGGCVERTTPRIPCGRACIGHYLNEPTAPLKQVRIVRQRFRRLVVHQVFTMRAQDDGATIGGNGLLRRLRRRDGRSGVGLDGRSGDYLRHGAVRAGAIGRLEVGFRHSEDGGVFVE